MGEENSLTQLSRVERAPFLHPAKPNERGNLSNSTQPSREELLPLGLIEWRESPLSIRLSQMEEDPLPLDSAKWGGNISHSS